MNLFALVNGLINLSAHGKPEMKPLADTLTSRLGALHRAHGPIRTETESTANLCRRIIPVGSTGFLVR
jgi:hypothetical protein